MSDRPGRPGPKYRQIAGDLRAGIASGKYPVGKKIPTKAWLQSEYGVALNTVDRALEELRREGLLRSEQGAGTFVEKMPEDGAPTPEFLALMSRLDEMEAAVRRLTERVAKLEQ